MLRAAAIAAVVISVAAVSGLGFGCGGDDSAATAPADRRGTGVAADTTLERAVGAALVKRGEMVATAESCTGGMISARITAVPGSSAWFAGGVVSYSNSVKESALGVPAGLITRHGAVSAEVADAMARGAMGRVGAAWAIAVTGLAGPGGGTPEKPVGLVYVAIGSPDGVAVRELHLTGDRAQIRTQATTRALQLLKAALAA